jgi:C4-dicarboxylate transporter DctM subunit
MEASLIFALAAFALMFLGIPIAVCLGLGAFIAILTTGQDIRLCTVMMYDALDTYILIAIPFFMLAGNIMARGGMANRIFDFANAAVGGMRGGLGAVNVVGSMIFGGMSGSATADAAGLGIIEIQEMVRYKYPLKYAAGITLVTSCMSSIIPPSIIMVVYGIYAGESVAKMLVAGTLPGMLVGVACLVTNYVMAIKYGWGAGERFQWRRVLGASRDAGLAIVTPVIIMGGILLGTVTPTEASCVAVLYALFVTVFVYKELKISQLPGVIKDTAVLAGVVMFIISTASLSSHLLTADNVPHVAAQFISTLTQHPTVGLGLVVIFLLFVGLFMEGIAAIIVLSPIFLPIAKAWNVDPIHFGVVMVTCMAIAVMTPPVGVCIYTICSISKLSMEDVAKAILPFSFGLFFALTLIVLIPSISLILIKIFW